MTSTNLKLSLIQFDIAWENPAENMERLVPLLENVGDADLIMLPEMWSTGFSMRPEEIAEPVGGPAFLWMMSKAQRMGKAICGSISTRDGNLFYNRFYCVFPDGQFFSYDKRHLFSYGKENLHYTPGAQMNIFNYAGWKIRPIICYDLRFPAWCRNTNEYDLLLVVANWPAARIHHWDALIMARGIENQCYVAAVNRVGEDGNQLEYPGHSQVVDMNGHSLEKMNADQSVGHSTISMEALRAFRDKFRFLQDRDHYILE